MITKLNVELEHCYGIKKLQTLFDFSQQNVYADKSDEWIRSWIKSLGSGRI